MMLFLFDVDGTLTPSRGIMHTEFAAQFTVFAQQHCVCLVTGSDYAKTAEQVPHTVLQHVHTVYNCSGSSISRKGKTVYSDQWQPSDKQVTWLEQELAASVFPLRTGTHIEQRTGMLNFSVVGRGATASERAQYQRWDQQHQERAGIAQRFNQRFPGFAARLGGVTGIDIAPAGSDKSQILLRLPKGEDLPVWSLDDLVFFGDDMGPQGNDAPLAGLLTRVHPVDDWQHTQQILHTEYGMAL